MRCIPDLSCLGPAGTAFIKSPAFNKSARSLLWFLAYYCDGRVGISVAPTERDAWREMETQCLLALGLRRLRPRGAPRKDIDPAFARAAKHRYNELRRYLAASNRNGGLDLKLIRTAFERLCDGWRPGTKLEAAIRQDVAHRRPTWSPLKRALAVWTGLGPDDFQRRVVDIKFFKRVPFSARRGPRWKTFRRHAEIEPTE